MQWLVVEPKHGENLHLKSEVSCPNSGLEKLMKWIMTIQYVYTYMYVHIHIHIHIMRIHMCMYTYIRMILYNRIYIYIRYICISAERLYAWSVQPQTCFRFFSHAFIFHRKKKTHPRAFRLTKLFYVLSLRKSLALVDCHSSMNNLPKHFFTRHITTTLNLREDTLLHLATSLNM